MLVSYHTMEYNMSLTELFVIRIFLPNVNGREMLHRKIGSFNAFRLEINLQLLLLDSGPQYKRKFRQNVLSGFSEKYDVT